VYRFLMIVLFLVAGCGVTQEVKEHTYENAARNHRFIELMDTGETTREQEQAFIRVNSDAWNAQNFAINDISLPEKE